MKMKRNPKIQKFLDDNFQQTENILKGLCPICNEPTEQFRDELSLREYYISGLCQKCQDKTHG